MFSALVCTTSPEEQIQPECTHIVSGNVPAGADRCRGSHTNTAASVPSSKQTLSLAPSATQPTCALVVGAQQGLAVGVDVAHVGKGLEESRANLLTLHQGQPGRHIGRQAGR